MPLHDERVRTMTPVHNRIPSQFRYQRTPSSVMPEPSIPERVILPQPGILDVFDIRVAADDTTEDDAFAIRWEVYCRDLGFEAAERFPDHREHDEADLRSVQVVAYHRGTGAPAGCFRLLLADPHRQNASFHLEEVCRKLMPDAIPLTGDARLGYAELSRFCITAPFRRFDAACDILPPGADRLSWHAEAIHRRGLAGLMWLTAAHLAVSLRLDYLLALMEPRLQLLGRTLGFTFQPIGEAVDFRGTRLPYRIDRRSLRTLLAIPQTAALMRPLVPGLDEALHLHPLLGPYINARTTRITRAIPGPDASI